MSPSHTVHPDSHTHGLADGCPRCEQHARAPLSSLDDINLRALMHRILDDEGSRSENEAWAMSNVEDVLQAAGKLATVEPRLLALYVLRKYRVQLVAIGKEGATL